MSGVRTDDVEMCGISGCEEVGPRFSILVEHPPDLMEITRVRERQHRKDPRLLGIRRVCWNPSPSCRAALGRHAAFDRPVV